MNQNTKRLALGTLVAFLVLTALFAILEKTALAITAYCAGLLAVIELAGTLLLVTKGTQNQYIINAAFPLISWNYLKWNFFVSIVFVTLEQTKIWIIPNGCFIFIHIVLLAIFVWHLLAMDSGKEEIGKTEQNVKVNTAGWKLLRADAQELLARTPAEFREEVASVTDAIRYADPMNSPALQNLDDAIQNSLHELDAAVSCGDAKKVTEISALMNQKIKDRNNRAKLLK